VPALPSSVIDPLWDQFAALLPEHVDTHPLGCHRPRIPDRVIFDKLVHVLVWGAAYERIADGTCSATSIRNRRDEWITVDAGQKGRLEEIRDNLTARIAEAEREGWRGEAENLGVSLAHANDKLAQLDVRARRAATINLGIPTFGEITGRTASPPRLTWPGPPSSSPNTSNTARPQPVETLAPR
jgi:transposase